MSGELRYFKAFFETRGTPSKIIGRIPYDSESVLMDDFVEVLKPGVFTESLSSGKDIKAYWSHDRAKVIGSTKAGTLRLVDSSTELKIELDPGSTSWGKDALEAVRRGDVSGFSFGFLPVDTQWENETRYVLKANLFEVSPVSEPAYPESKAMLEAMKARKRQKEM